MSGIERAAIAIAPSAPPHLFGRGGRAALDALLQRQPLLAFDFDGTLAPIVRRPEHARLAPALAAALQSLDRRLPLAVVSGRARDDLRERLGFSPRYLVGNHGAEDGVDAAAQAAWSAQLAPLRERLAAQALRLRDLGVTVEDKGLSIALHYRRAPQPALAAAALQALLQPLPAGLRSFGGKQVCNVVPAAAPDKAAAVQALVERSGAGVALFAGDDLNDEPVFAAAPPHWLTLRVGRPAVDTRARFRVDGPAQLSRLVQLLAARLTGPSI